MSGTEIIYGANPVIEALRSGLRRCHEVMISLGRKESMAAKVAGEADARRVQVSHLAKQELSRLCGTDRHQGLAARVDRYPYAELIPSISRAIEDPRKAFILALDGVADPQNLGSLIRTAHLMGVHCLILPRDNAAGITPSVVKASAGATEYLPIVQVTNLARTIEYLKESGVWVTGVEGGSEKSIYDSNFKGLNVALVLGSEGAGIRRLVRKLCDFLIFIPMEGKISSYNVSVAGALAMGEVARQRR
ncbi:MAG: 23S rRNA (guanosine(2251)-2'-O)-methyltransferase RlmB [Proteobacteria bacterium]|nr:23S rRNA (guanosine(2251)-2'-O)-methyltransferase RlmB [Pseudomonadota bacterium]